MSRAKCGQYSVLSTRLFRTLGTIQLAGQNKIFFRNVPAPSLPQTAWSVISLILWSQVYFNSRATLGHIPPHTATTLNFVTLHLTSSGSHKTLFSSPERGGGMGALACHHQHHVFPPDKVCRNVQCQFNSVIIISWNAMLVFIFNLSWNRFPHQYTTEVICVASRLHS